VDPLDPLDMAGASAGRFGPIRRGNVRSCGTNSSLVAREGCQSVGSPCGLGGT
jgi:hypothetical protein